MEACVFCHGPLDLTTQRCQQCGQLQPARSAPLPTASASSGAFSLRCPRCGEVLLAQSRFCPNCAQPLNLLPGSTFITPSTSGQLPLPPGQYPPLISEQISLLSPGQQPPQSQPPGGWHPSSPNLSTWQTPTPAPSGAVYPAKPTNIGPPPPPPPSLWDRIFGPRPILGTPVLRTNWVQRHLLPAQPTTAGSPWFGALAGAVAAFLITLVLSILFSLTAGPGIDSLFDQLYSSPTATVNFFSNPLLVFASAHLSEINFTYPGNTAGVGLPITLLSLFPMLGLFLGGSIAASTDFTGRRLFSIMRGASIGAPYALLTFIASLIASSTFNATIIAPNAGSAFLYALLGGAVFGALGGAWHARRLPRGPVTGQTRLSTRIHGALVGAGVAIGITFALCLLLTVILFINAQGNTSTSLASTPGFTGGLCSNSSQVASEIIAYYGLSNANLPVLLLSLVISPLEILWLMALSLGAPLQASEGTASVSIGLFGTNCPPGPQAQFLYLLLLIPAIALFLGGRAAARVAHPRTEGEAAGVAFLMAIALAILMLLVVFLATFSLTVSTVSASIGPSAGGTILASLIFGCTLGSLGSVSGRPRHPLPMQASPGGGWPMVPGP